MTHMYKRSTTFVTLDQQHFSKEKDAIEHVMALVSDEVDKLVSIPTSAILSHKSTGHRIDAIEDRAEKILNIIRYGDLK